MHLQNETWVRKYWRPVLGWHYIVVCTFDFVIAPLLVIILRAFFDVQMEAWLPLTLKEGGLYHLSMGGILGVTAWTRGKEKQIALENSVKSPE